MGFKISFISSNHYSENWSNYCCKTCRWTKNATKQKLGWL